LLIGLGLCVFIACGDDATARTDSGTDAGSLDAGKPVARQPDAGTSPSDAGDAGDASITAFDASQADASEGDDAGSPADASTDAGADAGFVCPVPAAGKVGGSCANDVDCESALGAGDGVCMKPGFGDVVWPAGGFCLGKVDACTIDADCGPNNLCATVNDPVNGAYKACLPACQTGGCVCGAGTACANWVAGIALAGGRTACLPGNGGASDGDPCASFGDCAEHSTCAADPLEHPGGQCRRFGCTPGNDATCNPNGDGHCIDEGLVTAGVALADVCVDACAVSGDCREAEGYRCFDAGGSVGKFCRHPQAGDACASDTDCGDAALWDCKTGAAYPGGSCAPATPCPTPGSTQGCSSESSICYDGPLVAATDNVCVDRCVGGPGVMGGCRLGYLCNDVNPGSSVSLGCVAP
jgi:hypothetical protein